MIVMLFFVVLMAEPENAPGVVLKLDVQNERGVVECLLYASAKGYPDDASKAFLHVSAKPAVGKPVECVFSDVPDGTYAGIVLHDEDADGELDETMLGVPTEAYGATNNKLPRLTGPTFLASSFVYARGERKVLVVKLRFPAH